ncbi:TraV family lipoprotein [Arcobacter butzleri]|uniref:TraV family lipoprotein n=1 Tax=Aliarcobacter butzleri TaxID=28197 RepID=UPI001587443A|nr:TraV family lipoprotein [Aliarcobacter butzleri]NUW25097.1 TraV family lipoprotein [Aliarcobacter butzleri]
MMKILTIGLLSIFILSGCSSKQETDVSSLKKVSPQEKIVKIDSLYEKERKEFLVETMYSSKIPVKTPDKILRVLVMPYVDEDMNLQTENFHFIKVDDGRWILGEYLNGQDKSNPKSLTPLK